MPPLVFPLTLPLTIPLLLPAKPGKDARVDSAAVSALCLFRSQEADSEFLCLGLYFPYLPLGRPGLLLTTKAPTEP